MRCDIEVRRFEICTACVLTFLLLALTFSLLALPGCGQTGDRSSAAVDLPALPIDPVEKAHATENWPQWRGPNSCGVSADTNLPIEWSLQQGIRWKQAVAGRGNSSPVVWGDRVLVTSAVGESDPAQLFVDAFDRKTGAPQWHSPAGQTSGTSHNKNGYASASVATDGDAVFASFGSAGLFCFDLATGHQRWHADLGSLSHQWGTASSPVLVGEAVIQLCDSEKESSLRAFGKSNGQPLWTTPRPSTGCWSTPVVVEGTDAAGKSRTELVVNGTGADGSGAGWVIAYDPANGHELWRVQGTTEVVCPTAIVGGDLVISTSGRNGPIFAIKPGGNGNVTDTNVVWKHAKGGAYVPTGVAYRSRLYTIADGGVISCFNLGSGEEIWRNRLRGTFTSSLVAAEGHIYATNEYGMVYVFAAADKFEQLAANDMQERTLATPAIADGDLFIRTETQLYCIAGSAAQKQPASQTSAMNVSNRK
jgi:outer membrane protein assembly factor BamB